MDTAGIRKKNKVTEDLEYYSVIRSIRSIENSDVCILMIDATRGIEGQDLNIFSLIQRNQKGLVVVVNKWDLVENKDAKVMKSYEEAIRSRFAPFVDFPIIFASAMTKQRIFKVLEMAKEVYHARTTRIPTARLNEEMLPLIEAYPIEPEEPYSDEYNEVVDRFKNERDNHILPALRTKVENMDDYDTLIIGSPIWGGLLSSPVKSFLSGYDLSGKKILPFCTHGGSGTAQSVDNIRKLCPHAEILLFMAVKLQTLGMK